MNPCRYISKTIPERNKYLRANLQTCKFYRINKRIVIKEYQLVSTTYVPFYWFTFDHQLPPQFPCTGHSVDVFGSFTVYVPKPSILHSIVSNFWVFQISPIFYQIISFIIQRSSDIMASSSIIPFHILTLINLELLVRIPGHTP